MEISLNEWQRYILKLSRLGNEATNITMRYIKNNGIQNVDALVNYIYQVSSTLGEAAASLASEMYDEIAAASGVTVPPAIPAQTAEYGEVAGAVKAVAAESPSVLPSVAGRMVKQAAADTTLKNALRDKAQFAWIPHGDTCPFCLMIASRGWQNISKKALKNGHAEHIHNNCDCEYAVRFNDNTTVAGYDPDKYLEQYENAEGNNWRQKLNSMRREAYQEQKIAEELKQELKFTPVATLAEAEDYAKKFVWDYGGKTSYKGVSIDSANAFNKALDEVYTRFEPDRIQSIEPMNFRTNTFRNAVDDGVIAAYRWGNGQLYINQKILSNSKTLNATMDKVNSLYKSVTENADVLLSKPNISALQKQYVEALVESGCQCVSQKMDNMFEATVVHEMGHMLDDQKFRKAFKAAGFDVRASKEKFGKAISGYAVSDNKEYVAESFCSYFYGKTESLDPELVDIFERFDKWI